MKRLDCVIFVGAFLRERRQDESATESSTAALRCRGLREPGRTVGAWDRRKNRIDHVEFGPSKIHDLAGASKAALPRTTGENLPSIYVEDADLDLCYEDSGPRGRTVVLLLHGWPDDASTWTDVARHLNEAGLRTIVPTLRSFGSSRFRSAAALRNGQSRVL